MISKNFGRFIFALIAVCLISFFGYDGYIGNSSLSKSSALWDVLLVGALTGSFFIVPLLIGLIFSCKSNPNDLPLAQLFVLCLGATIQSALCGNFLYILIWPTNIVLSWWVGARCYAGYKIAKNEAEKQKGQPPT